jgi:hypothetical protein
MLPAPIYLVNAKWLVHVVSTSDVREVVACQVVLLAVPEETGLVPEVPNVCPSGPQAIYQLPTAKCRKVRCEGKPRPPPKTD